MKIQRQNPVLFAAMTLAGLTIATTPGHGQTNGTWDGGGANGIWGGVNNWNPNNQIATGVGATATFGSAFANGYNITVNTARTVGNIVFTDPASANDMTLVTHSNDFILTLDVASGSPSVTVTQADRTLTINPRIAGNEGLTKNGPGKLVLTNANSTYTGAISINDGILEIGGAGRVGSGVHAGNVTIASGATFHYNSSSDTVLSGIAGGGGTLSKAGGGTLTLTGANTYAGITTVTGGALLATSPAALPGYDSPGRVVFNGGTIGVSVGGSGWTTSEAETLLANATKTGGAFGIDTTGGDLTQWAAFTTGNLGPALGLTKLGGNTLTLNLANSYTGTTTVRGGTLALSGTGTPGTAANHLTLSGGAFNLGSLVASVGAVSITAAAASGETLSNGSLAGTSYAASNPSGNAIISANLLPNGTAGFTKSGLGTVTLAGANTYTGATLVEGGTLKFSTAGSATTHITVADGATHGVLVASNNGQWTNTGDLTHGNNSTLLIDYGSSTPGTAVAPMKVANFNPGTGVSVKVAADSFAGFTAGQSYPLVTWTAGGPADASALTLALPHRVAGNLSVSGSTLFLNLTYSAPGPVSWKTGNGTWDTITANWLDSSAAPTTYVDLLDVVVFGDAAGATGNPTVTLDTPLAPASVTMASKLRDYTLTGTGGIGGNSSLTLDSENTRTLSIDTFNTYSGATTISGGKLKLGASEVIPDGTGKGNVTLNGTLDLNGNSETLNGLAGSGTVDTIGGGFPTLTVGGNNVTSTFSGVIKNTADALTLAKSGTGRLILSGANTYTGGTIITGGTLQIGEGGTSGSIGSGGVQTSGTLEFNRSDNLVLAEEISGTGGVRQSGTGTLILSAENSYAGATTASGGTLKLTGNRTLNAGAINVISGAVLEVSNGSFSCGATTFSVGGTSGISTFNQTGGNISFTSGNQVIIGNGTGDGVYNLSTGTLATVAGTGGRGVIVGTNTGRAGTFNLTGTGELAMAGGSVLQIARSDGSAATGTTGTFNQTGGTATVGDLRLGGSNATANANGTATLNLSGGTFTAATFTSLSGGNDSVSTINISGTAAVTLPAFPVIRGTGAKATVTFDGGVLKPAAGSETYLGGLDNAFIKAGGARFDTTNGSITVTQGLQEDPMSGGGGLTKEGPNTLTLSGANSYGGGTTITGGTLALGADNALPGSTAVSIGDATLDAATFTHSLGTLDVAGSATLNLGTGSKLVFANSSAINWSGGTLNLTGNFVSGVSIRFGTGSNALVPAQLALISASGFSAFALDANGFLTATATGGYGAWNGANAGGQGPDLDWDNDGVPNGVEYFMNAAAGFTAAPVLNGSNTITWSNGGKIPASAYGSQFVVQTSGDLVIWSDVPAGNLAANTDGPGGALTYTLTGPGRRFVRLKVTPN